MTKLVESYLAWQAALRDHGDTPYAMDLFFKLADQIEAIRTWTALGSKPR